MYEEISQNKRNSFILIIIFVAGIVFLGYLFGLVAGFGPGAMIFAFIISALMALAGYFNGDKIVLAVSRAQLAAREKYPQLYNIVEELTIASGLPMPKLYIVHDGDAPNAFATGRDPAHSSIAVTTALLNRLNRTELQGVLAHELSHVGDYDILFATLIGILVGMVAMFSDFFLRYTFWTGGGRRKNSSGGSGAGVLMVIALILAILAPLFALIIQLTVSRQREYLADANAALMTRYPEGLASALEKISRNPGVLEVSNRATQHLYIISPIKSIRDRKKSSLFSTHPPVAERIRRLRGMAGNMASGVKADGSLT
ncbi:MAG: M48 family metallopeptidase [Candidatus Euphemobacter frigidus]|nr:M48 family metallopeptidase [Candidatus Euphemobacter frigidus]